MMGLLMGIWIIEFVGIGLGLFVVMMLVDYGVEVICIEWFDGWLDLCDVLLWN